MLTTGKYFAPMYATSSLLGDRTYMEWVEIKQQWKLFWFVTGGRDRNAGLGLCKTPRFDI